MHTRLKPTEVDCKYGAPMGRRNVLPEDTNEPVRLRMVRLRFIDYAYDEGGAYWGIGNPIYFAKGEASDVIVEIYVRAKDREDAKAQVTTLLPNATFYR